MPAALLLVTFGGLLVYSALHGKGITDILAGNVGDPLNPAGGDVPTNGSASTDDADTGAAGVGTFDGKLVANWIIPILKYARKRGWQGHVSSGYRNEADQARVCATGVRPCAAPGKSNHQGKEFPGGAVDVTDAVGLSGILLTSPYATKLVWAGAKDPVHFSHPHGGSY